MWYSRRVVSAGGRGQGPGGALPPAEIGRQILDPAILTCPVLILPSPGTSVQRMGTRTNTDIRRARGPRYEYRLVQAGSVIPQVAVFGAV